jgi:hypothetical protein
MLRKSLFFLTLSALFWARASWGVEAQSRTVIGGDVVFTSSASGATQDEALFRAEAQAVRMITIECSIPHKETKIFNQSLTSSQGRFQARVSAGLPVNSCEEAQNATPERKKFLTSETLASEQSAYEKVLFGEKVIVKPVQAKAEVTPALFSQLKKADYQFNPQFIASYQRYLSDKTDCREKIRYFIRQGDNAQADALMMQCR